MSKKTDALKAISAAEEVCRQTWSKLNDAIAYRRVRRRDVSQYVRLRTRALRRQQTFTQIKNDIQAASVVVRAPTPAEIAAVQALLAKVKQISVQDAARKAGLKLLTDTFGTLNSSTKGVKAA